METTGRLKQTLIVVVTATVMAAVAALVWVQTRPDPPPPRPPVDDRAGTAAAVAELAYPEGSGEVFLARVDNPVDALAGASLGRRGPLLFVPQCGPVAQSVLDEVARLKPREVTPLGGSEAVCPAVLDQVRAAAGLPSPDEPVG